MNTAWQMLSTNNTPTGCNSARRSVMQIFVRVSRCCCCCGCCFGNALSRFTCNNSATCAFNVHSHSIAVLSYFTSQHWKWYTNHAHAHTWLGSSFIKMSKLSEIGILWSIDKLHCTPNTCLLGSRKCKCFVRYWKFVGRFTSCSIKRFHY